MVRRWLLAALSAALLAGRVSSFTTIAREWPSLKGKPIEAAVAMFGYPQSEQTILGDKVYTWSTSEGHVSLSPVSGVAYGTAVGQPMSVSTVSYAATPTTLSCVIKIGVGSDNKIKRREYDGNNGACHAFADAMRRQAS